MARFSVEAIISAKDKFTKPIAKMEKRFSKFSRVVERGMRKANRVAGRFKAGLRKVGVAALAAGAVIGGVFANIIRTGMEFEQTLTAAAAKFPEGIKKGTKEFEALSQKAQEVGATTEFTASQAADGLNFLAMAGFNATQAMAALPGVVNLATAAQVELGTASDFATDTLGAFNLMTEDATQLQANLARVSDVMAKTSTSANTTFEEMFEAIKKVGPTAVAAGSDIEQVSSGIAILANAGIKGGEAGTALRNMFLRLAAPAAAGSKALKKLNIEVGDGQGGLKDLSVLMGELAAKTEGMSKKAKLKLLDAIFGKRTVGPALTLMEAGTEGMKAFEEAMNAAQGTSDKMAGTMRNTVQGSLKGLASAVESVKIKIFDMEKGPLKDTIDSMTDWVRANKDLIATKIADFLGAILENLPLIWTWFKRIGITVAALWTLATAVQTITTLMTAWKYAGLALNLVMAANPVVLVIAAILAGIALIVAYWPEITALFTELWQAMKLVGMDIKAWFVEVVDSIKAKLMGAFDFIKNGAAKFASFFGIEFGGGGETAGSTRVEGPGERTVKSINESTSIDRSELTIRATPGTEFMSTPPTGSNISLEPSGAF